MREQHVGDDREPYQLTDDCPCDQDFVDWLRQDERLAMTAGTASIFHFGTGWHHLVGRQAAHTGHHTLGLTVCEQEHRNYVDLVRRDNHLALFYKVLYADVYTLETRCLPMFDVVTLFHLCEYHGKSKQFARHDDAGLLRMMTDKLNLGGRMLFFRYSQGWEQAWPLVQGCGLRRLKDFRSLLVYGKDGAS